MPKLKRQRNKYERLQILIRGNMETQGVTITDLSSKLGRCRQVVSDKLKNPGSLTLDDLAKLSSVLGISMEEIRAAIKF